MNNFQIFANHRILDSNLQYCLYINDDHIPVNDTVIRISCQSSQLTPAGYCQFGIIVHTIRLPTVHYYHLLILFNHHIHVKCQCTTMSSEIISSPNIVINNIRSTCEEDVLSAYVSSMSQHISTINSNNSSINSIYFIGVLISSKKCDTYIY